VYKYFKISNILVNTTIPPPSLMQTQFANQQSNVNNNNNNNNINNSNNNSNNNNNGNNNNNKYPLMNNQVQPTKNPPALMSLMSINPFSNLLIYFNFFEI
jgi:hypothetical protein